jgi:H+/Cl- antiporter ClcA/CBS domain-containing protein
MTDHESVLHAPTGGLPVAPSLEPSLAAARVPRRTALVDRRVLLMCGLAVGIAAVAALAALGLVALIALVTNLAFFGRLSTAAADPAGHGLGAWAVGVPVVGGLVVGVLARYGSAAIRGHGIPEAMEQVLVNESRISPRLVWLKPLSAAIAIGTGGPFGAEGPIIATGGALGSLVGQLVRTTALERKTLLAAGAAAGMAATFGTPVSAVLLAVELLLFEFRPRSLVPVALAAATAAGVRLSTVGDAPFFAMPEVVPPTLGGLAVYVAVGALCGVAAVGVTRAVYAIEDTFERLPVHWMWWPALGGLAVGVVGLLEPRTLGVGYGNISVVLGGGITGGAVGMLCGLKFVSWAVALGSGTSGGTLAPLFTIGGGVGALLGAAAVRVLPAAGVDPRIAALVGMAAVFGGASRALLASVVFAYETTRQPLGLLPLLGGGTAAYLVSCLVMPNTIMTEKIVRRGVRVPAEYHADWLERVLVRDAASAAVTALGADTTVGAARAWLASGARGAEHQGFPVLGAGERLVGVVTRRDLLDPGADPDATVGAVVKRPPAVAYEDSTLREAADHMVEERVGRLPVVTRSVPWRVVGVLTRSDLLAAHARRLDEARRRRRVIVRPAGGFRRARRTPVDGVATNLP